MAKSIKLNAFFNVVRTISRLLFPLVVFPYVSRVLLPEGVGKVNFASSIITYFSIIATLGIGTYGLREAAKIRKNRIELSKFTKEIFIINIISTIISYILLFISVFIFKKFSEYKLLLFVSSSVLLLNVLGFEWLYSALEEYVYITIRSIVFQFVSLILTFAFVKSPDDVVVYALISVISSAGVNLCNLLLIRKFIDFSVKEKLQIKKHLKPIFLLFFSSIAITVFSVLDTSMVGFIKDDIEVGYYSAASKIVRMIRDLFPAISTVLIARVSYYVGTKEYDKIKIVTKDVLNLYYAFSIPITCGLILLMRPVIMLMCGKDFLPAVITGQVMAPLVILSSVSGYLSGALLISFGKDRTYLSIELGAAFLDIILNYSLIPKFGALGAAVATLLTELLMFVVFHFCVWDIIKEIKIVKSIFQYSFASLLMFVCLFFLIQKINNIYLQIFVCTLIGVLIYLVVLIFLKNEYLFKILKECKNKMGVKNEK